MAKQSRWRELLRKDAGRLGAFLAAMTGIVVIVLLDAVLGDSVGTLVPPGIGTLIFVIVGVAVTVLVYFAVASVRDKKE